MTDSPFRGVIPPVVIPLDEKRQLDLEAFERSINRMIDAGVDGLFFLGALLLRLLPIFATSFSSAAWSCCGAISSASPPA